MNITELITSKIKEDDNGIDISAIVKKKRDELREKLEAEKKEQSNAATLKRRHLYLERQEEKGFKQYNLMLIPELIEFIDEEIRQGKYKKRSDLINELLAIKYEK